ncbi:MAG: sulfatase [Verrucomicrobiales bacterium]|nr:sulfatase [Verrucomicrobiales bacterium]
MTRLLLPLLLITCHLSLAAENRPNVLFVAIDDLNDWVSPLGGHPQVKTPNFDRLAKRGTTFTNAHCQSPLCNPSRTSLMTGRRPSSTGIYGLAPWFRNVPGLKDLTTIPDHFKANGYSTYSTGKIYHGGYGRKKGDNEFDHLGPGATGAPFPAKKLVDTPQPHKLVDWGTFPHKDEDKGDYKIASWAVDTLDSKPAGPFFLSCGFFLPHVPCYATQKWFDLYPEDTLTLPPMMQGDRDDTPRSSWFLHWQLPEPRLKFLQETDEWKNITRSYLACVSFVDHQLGRVLDALDRNGYTDNTVVVLWSDHGFHLGEKLITGKNTLWDPSTRVPLIFAGPGVSGNARCHEPAELLDIYPTLCDLTNLPKPGTLEGISLKPQLEDTDAKRAHDRPAITTHNPGNHGVRTRDWRYIRYTDGAEELYDMTADPEEFTNLATDPAYATKLAELRPLAPATSAPPAPNSRARILTYENGIPVWEGKPIGTNDPVPEL